MGTAPQNPLQKPATNRRRRKNGSETPWQCSRRSLGELSGPCCLETHIFIGGSLALFRIVRANVPLNIAMPSRFGP